MRSTQERLTYASLLKQGEELLAKAEVPEARLDAWLLLEYASAITRAWYFAHTEEQPKEGVEDTYRKLIADRAKRIPLQHLTHQACFMGHSFYVDERVLVPRQDTEVLVEEALMRLAEYAGAPAGAGQTLRILDLCTGSGCILLSILAERPDASGTGTDISADALDVARINAGRLSVQDRAEFVRSDLFLADVFQEKDGKVPEKYDMLISNPPYIPTAQISDLMEEVRLHDPLLALDGREDGLYFYREITRQAVRFLKPGGWILFEIGYDQGAAVRQILTDRGFTDVSVLQDLAGQDRVAKGKFGIRDV